MAVEMNAFDQAARRLVQFLEHEGELQWALAVEQLTSRVIMGRGSIDLREALADVFRLFGGMGSLSDLVLQGPSGPLASNDELSRLREALHSAAADLVGCFRSDGD